MKADIKEVVNHLMNNKDSTRIKKTRIEDGRANNNVQPSLEIVGGPTSEELESALEPLEGGAGDGGLVGGGVVGGADVEAP